MNNDNDDEKGFLFLKKITLMQRLVESRKSEQSQALTDRFPDLYRDTNETGGISIDLGWYPLIERLSERLQAISDRTGVRIQVTQVKQKFGTLRYYFEFDERSEPISADVVKEVVDLVDSYEKESEHICELCGSSEGHTQKIGRRNWVRTLCDPCELERKHIAEEEVGEWGSGIISLD